MNNKHGRNDDHTRPQFIERMVRRYSVFIIVGCLGFVALIIVGVPSLEQVGQEHSIPLSPADAPSMVAMKRIGQVFQESDSDSVAMIVLESDRALGEDARIYYANLIRKLKGDTAHVQHIQDFWGDSLTAAGAQSPDGKAAYVQLTLAGNQGETLANESIEAVRKIVARAPPPQGVRVFVTGVSALITDMHTTGNESILKITAASVGVIFMMLLLVYRSAVTVVLILAMVGVEFAAARGVVAFLGHHGFIGLSTFAVNVLTALVIAAGTDYAIFLVGRYQEARQSGEDRETAYYSTYRGVAHVILGSGLTIAGAMYCLNFARLPDFQTMGVPCAVGTLVVVAIALTLVRRFLPQLAASVGSTPSAPSKRGAGGASVPSSFDGPHPF